MECEELGGFSKSEKGVEADWSFWLDKEIVLLVMMRVDVS
jgi:hypothetical protein